MQTALLSPVLTTVMTFFYTLHLPLVVLTSICFWHSDRTIYRKYVYAIVITSYCALVTFLLFPTAPPWYEGVARDFLHGLNSAMPLKAYASLMSMIEADKFAAFPSLHTAYAVIFLYYMKKGRRYGLIALPISAGILFSTIYLGQHYVIDLIGGAAYSMATCLLVDWISKCSELKKIEATLQIHLDNRSPKL